MYDVIIKSTYKDYHKLPLVIDSLAYLNPVPDNIYILTPDGFRPSGTDFDLKIISIMDEDVVPHIDRSRLECKRRKNWVWVNLVSITQEFTQNDLYLDVQSDNFFLRPIDIFENGKPKLFQSVNSKTNNDGSLPYFKFSENVFGIEKMNRGYSYIIEFLMYDRKLLKEFFSSIYGSTEEMIEVIYSNVSIDCYPADQEIFGNLIEKYFPDKYVLIPNTPVMFSGINVKRSPDKIMSVDELKEYIKKCKSDSTDAIACSHHSWA